MDDDLDAFFADVSEVAAKAVEAKSDGNANQNDASLEEEEKVEAPRAKKQKISMTHPRGIVVASSTSVVLPAKEIAEKESHAVASLGSNITLSSTTHSALPASAMKPNPSKVAA